MRVIYILIPIALTLGMGFLATFIIMAFSGQYDDLETPRFRILIEDEKDSERIEQ